MIDQLDGMGYHAYTHSFSHGGMTLHNVIADLPGTGTFTIDPEILERIRMILVAHPFPIPLETWLKPILKLLGREWLG